MKVVRRASEVEERKKRILSDLRLRIEGTDVAFSESELGDQQNLILYKICEPMKVRKWMYSEYEARIRKLSGTAEPQSSKSISLAESPQSERRGSKAKERRI